MQLLVDKIHVWKACLHIPSSMARKLWSLLNPEEQQRANRFRFNTHRQKFIASQSALRLILGRYLNEDPRVLSFEKESWRKPYLSRPATSSHLSFNLAHSGEHAVYAVSWDRRVGIDIEYHRLKLDVAGIIESVCSTKEKLCMKKLSLIQQQEAFFACWTRKEAYLKATGKGLSLPLNRLTVSFMPGEPAALLDVNGEAEERSRWLIRNRAVEPDYTAALVGEGNN